MTGSGGQGIGVYRNDISVVKEKHFVVCNLDTTGSFCVKQPHIRNCHDTGFLLLSRAYLSERVLRIISRGSHSLCLCQTLQAGLSVGAKRIRNVGSNLTAHIPVSSHAVTQSWALLVEPRFVITKWATTIEKSGL
jgi:hypothetical protein